MARQRSSLGVRDGFSNSLENGDRTIQTAFMERWYGTLRGWVAPLRCRTRCLSWSQVRHQGRIWLIVSLYNFVIPHKSLGKGWTKRTPAMAMLLFYQTTR